jgi:hypothetical protein
VLNFYFFKNYKNHSGTNDRISAAARMSPSQADVTQKKHFIPFPQKIMKLAGYFISCKTFLLCFGGKTFYRGCLGFRCFIADY